MTNRLMEIKIIVSVNPDEAPGSLRDWEDSGLREKCEALRNSVEITAREQLLHIRAIVSSAMLTVD